MSGPSLSSSAGATAITSNIGPAKKEATRDTSTTPQMALLIGHGGCFVASCQQKAEKFLPDIKVYNCTMINALVLSSVAFPHFLNNLRNSDHAAKRL